jgi:(R,R)-butanediol dehydrogenase / meso-butanediol dehydrogenase / diacetyl reductase
MKAVRYHGERDIRVEDIDDPGPPGPGQLLVQPLWCGICGTDLHEYTSGPIVTPSSPHPLNGAVNPQVLGHEFSATVLDVGEGVTNARKGDRVSIMPLIFCGRCDMCRLGANHLCRTMACTGLSSATGGLSERAIVEEYQVAVLPESVTDTQGALVEPTAVALYGFERARPAAGERVLVTGAGPIGALTALIAHALGAGDVFIAEPNPNRARFAESLEVGRVFTSVGDELVAEIMEATDGLGVDTAIECAGKAPALNACIDAVRPRGTVVQTGLHVVPATTSPETWALKDLTIEATWCYRVTDWPRVIRLIGSGSLPVERVVTAQLGLDHVVRDGFDRLIDPSGNEVKVLASANG